MQRSFKMFNEGRKYMSNNNATSSKRYTMSIALGVLNHLGLNLYSNTAAALSEAVANGWDADASQVIITLAPDEIVIEDDGSGMTLDDVNEKFLMVGYDRRKVGPDITPKGRPIMGRKGIGKLSLFSIGDDVVVQTARDGERQEAFRMNVDEIRAAIDDRRDYNPEEVTAVSSLTKGTRITLRQLHNDNIAATRSPLRRRLARRFSVIGTEEFQVSVDGKPITYTDRDDLKQVQFLWQIGKPIEANLSDKTLFPYFDSSKSPGLLSGEVDLAKGWNVTGWIGTAKEPKNLKSSDDRQAASLNSIVVLSRGRLIQEDILPSVNESRLIRNYITGQIEASFLDVTGRRDIATSDRQRIQEDDERYRAVVAFVSKVVKEIANVWTDYRVEVGEREAVQENPVLQEWLDTFADANIKKLARQMLGKIQALEVDSDEERKDLFRQSIFAFERFNMGKQLAAFVESIGRDSDRAALAFNTLDDLEAILYAQIVKNRLDVITSIQKNIEEKARERVFQERLFDHLWLLDPSWERATESPLMEREFHTMLGPEATVGEDVEGLLGNRLDIKYRTAAGKHIIVELKRSSRTMRTTELTDQGERYRVLLAKVLSSQTSPYASQPASANQFLSQIEVVFVVGKKPVDAVGRADQELDRKMSIINGRVVTYTQLVGYAKKAYEEYLDKHESIVKLNQLVEKLSIGLEQPPIASIGSSASTSPALLDASDTALPSEEVTGVRKSGTQKRKRRRRS